jgi:hypothetical protein
MHIAQCNMTFYSGIVIYIAWAGSDVTYVRYWRYIYSNYAYTYTLGGNLGKATLRV